MLSCKWMAEINAAPGALELVRSLVNTVRRPDGPDTLDTLEGAAMWSAAHGLARLRDEAELRRLRALREIVRDLLSANSGERASSASWDDFRLYLQDVRLGIAADEIRGVVIEPQGEGLDAIVAAILVAIHEATLTGTWRRLRACRKPSCRFAFYDHTRNAVRAWCDMATCGNREKARRRRARERTTATVSRRVPTNIPLRTPALIGREAELREIARALRRSRLVTITGAAGVGKTQAAKRAAIEALDAFAGGVWFIDLAAPDPSIDVTAAIAAVLDVSASGSQDLGHRLAASLRAKETLLVLDNCEQILAGVAEVSQQLLRASPGLRILATSRIALGAHGEEPLPLAPLKVPPAGVTAAKDIVKYSAAELFIACARSAERTFALSDTNAAVIAQVVRAVDGVPLAIELAASRVAILDPSQIRSEQRQTVPALVAWSYGLLSNEERLLLRSLSVLRGTWTLDAALALCGAEPAESGAIRSRLASLAEKALLALESGEGEQRYRLLESTQQFALERLTEAGELHAALQRHCRHFARLALQMTGRFWQSAVREWHELVRADLDNYCTAIAWGLTQRNDVEAGMAIVAGIRPDTSLPASGTALAFVEQSRGAITENTPARVQGLLALALVRLSWPSSDLAAPREAIDALTQAGDEIHAVEARVRMCFVLDRALRRPGEALKIIEPALKSARALAAPRLVTYALEAMALTSADCGQRERAEQLYDEAVALARAGEDWFGLSRVIMNRAVLPFEAGEPERALELLHEAVALLREHRPDSVNLLLCLTNVTACQLSLKRFEEAAVTAREAFALGVQHDNAYVMGTALDQLAQIAAEQEDLTRSAQLLGCSDHLFASRSHERGASENSMLRTRVALESGLSSDELNTLMEQGAAADPVELVAESETGSHGKRRFG